MVARQGEMVWRVTVGEQVLYVYILLEFQSGMDRNEVEQWFERVLDASGVSAVFGDDVAPA